MGFGPEMSDWKAPVGDGPEQAAQEKAISSNEEQAAFEAAIAQNQQTAETGSENKPAPEAAKEDRESEKRKEMAKELQALEREFDKRLMDLREGKIDDVGGPDGDSKSPLSFRLEVISMVLKDGKDKSPEAQSIVQKAEKIADRLRQLEGASKTNADELMADVTKRETLNTIFAERRREKLADLAEELKRSNFPSIEQNIKIQMEAVENGDLDGRHIAYFVK